MNLAGVTEFAKLMADKINELYGSTVTYSGIDYRAVVTTGTPEFNLEAGGFQSPVQYVVRIRKSDMPEDNPFEIWNQGPPSVKSSIIIGGKTYYIFSVRQSFSALSQEWILEVGTP